MEILNCLRAPLRLGFLSDCCLVMVCLGRYKGRGSNCVFLCEEPLTKSVMFDDSALSIFVVGLETKSQTPIFGWHIQWVFQRVVHWHQHLRRRTEPVQGCDRSSSSESSSRSPACIFKAQGVLLQGRVWYFRWKLNNMRLRSKILGKLYLRLLQKPKMKCPDLTKEA